MTTLPSPHVSHSQLTGWAERCQKAFELQRIRRAPETPAWWLVGGSTVHEVTEELDRRGLEFGLTPADLNVTLEVEELTLAKLNELIAKTEESSGVPSTDWFAAGRSPQNRNYWEQNAPLMVQNWLSWRTRTGWEIATFDFLDPYGDKEVDVLDVPGIELDLGVTMEAAPVVGAPDRVFVLPNGELVVVDVKSGSSTPKTVAQMGLYATVLEMLGQRRPRYGTFVKVKEEGGRHTPLAPLAKYDQRYFEIQFAGLKAQVETGIFLPNVGDNCRTCGVSGSCYAAGGALSAKYDPLDPNYQKEN